MLGPSLAVLWMGVLEDFDDQIYKWDSPLVSLAMWLLLVAGVYTVAGVACFRRCSDHKAATAVPFTCKFLVVVYLFRLMVMYLCIAGRGEPFSLYYVEDESMWKDWYQWAGLLLRWPSECMLLLFLYHLGECWRHEVTLSRLRWTIALLVGEAMLQLGVAVGLFAWCETLFVTHSRLGSKWVGGLLAVPMVLVRLAIVFQLLRVLHATRCALAGSTDQDESP